MSDTAFTKRTGFRSRLGVAVTTLAITGTLLAALVAPAASAGVPRTARVAAMAASPAQESAQSQLYATMRQLWGQHMEWTYETIVAFATNPSALTPTLDRLLQNQTDIGNAVAQYYGQAAGNQLSTLLHAHINGYVPVLQDAKAGNTAALNTDFAKVLANGQQIGAFLGSANPNWSAADMSNMMTVHNQETLTYAGDILQGNWPQYITDYGTAEAHMYSMGDMLSAGIIAQFPNDFATSPAPTTTTIAPQPAGSGSTPSTGATQPTTGQVSQVPVGAPQTGGGSTARSAALPVTLGSIAALIGLAIVMVALRRRRLEA